MPSLRDLVENSPNFNYYYGGPGNFTQDKMKFGNDRPGGGSSGEPYVITPKGFKWSPSNFDDGLIRDGIVGATTRTAADVVRITKFFTDFPKGPLFIAKQVGLQLTNPLLEHREDRNTSNIFNKIQNDIGPTRIYNLGVNTLAQVAGFAFGQHFVRHGISPVMNDKDKYFSIVKSNNELGNNRLVKNLIRLSKPGSDTDPISEYKSGPGSSLGIGKTTINRYETSLLSSTNPAVLNSFIPYSVQDLYNINNKTGEEIFQPHPEKAQTAVLNNAMADETNATLNVREDDFRKIKALKYNADIPYSDYFTYKIERRIGVGSARGSDKSRKDYTIDDPLSSDRINSVSLYYADSPVGNGTTTDVNGIIIDKKAIRDLIKFRIEAVDNDNPLYSVWLIFRAYITNMVDNMKATWNPYSYTGRGEIFYRYQDFKPSFSFDLMIAAQSRSEMKPLYQKLNYLKSLLAPDYNSNNKMRGSFVKLTVGDYMYRQPGFINDLDISIDDNYSWEIALQEPENERGVGTDSDMHELPMILKCSISFTPVFDFLPRKGASVPFISGLLKRDGANFQKDWLYTNDSSGGRISLEQAINNSKPKTT